MSTIIDWSDPVQVRGWHRDYMTRKKATDPDFLAKVRASTKKSDKRRQARLRDDPEFADAHRKQRRDHKRERRASDPEFKDRTNRNALRSFRKKSLSGHLAVGTVFSGIGAAELALRRLGVDHTVEFASDCDKFCRQSYEANHEAKIWYDDVDGIDGSMHQIDLLVGGPPCQPYSTAGKKGGLDDPRGLLIFEFARIVREAAPYMFLFENVPPLLTMDNGSVWRMLLRDFAKSGYAVHHDVLNAADYGIPQNRKRVFAVGFKNAGDLAPAFRFPKKRELVTNVGHYLEDVVPGRYALTEKGIAYVMARRDDYKGADGQINNEVARPILSSLAKQHRAGVDNYYSGRLVNGKFVLGKSAAARVMKKTRYYKNPRADREIAMSQLANQYGKVQEAGAVYYTTDPRPAGLRRLTPLECHRLMGFDDSYKIVVSDAQAYHQAGNSVVVDVLEAVLTGMISYRNRRLREACKVE